MTGIFVKNHKFFSDFCLMNSLKFKKFSPAALKMEENWLLELQNSKNFRLRR